VVVCVVVSHKIIIFAFEQRYKNVKEHINSCNPLNYHHLCRKLTKDSVGAVLIPDGEKEYSNRFEIIKSSEECDLGNGDVIHVLNVRNGIPITLKNEEYFLVPENFVIYVEPPSKFAGPVNGFSVLRSIKTNQTDSGVYIPESQQDTNTYEAMIVQTDYKFLKADNKVWINKFSNEYGRFPITIDGEGCFLFPNSQILAVE